MNVCVLFDDKFETFDDFICRKHDSQFIRLSNKCMKFNKSKIFDDIICRTYDFRYVRLSHIILKFHNGGERCCEVSDQGECRKAWVLDHRSMEKSNKTE